MIPVILERVKELGYAVFEDGLYNLNIIGIRSKDSVPNTFDDRLCVAYKDADGWLTRTWAATTDPGRYYLENPMNVAGTAVLKPGQYRSAFRIGMHRGQYEALVQCKNVDVYRDINRNAVVDPDTTVTYRGTYGINIHKAGGHSTSVDKWSAACQVFANSSDFQSFMDLCRKQVSERGWHRFTYTLIEV